MKIIVHYGMPKTGSSSIQRSYFLNMPDPKFHYLKIVNGPCQNDAVKVLFKSPTSQAVKVRVEDTGDDNWKLLEQSCKERIQEAYEHCRQQDKVAILSAEAIHNFHPPDLYSLHEGLSAFWSDIIAVGYVRPPKAAMESGFQQRVKMNIPQTWDAQALYPNLKQKFARLDRVFGKANVQVWKFDPARFAGGDVVLDFSQRLGIRYSENETIRVNEAISLPALSLLYTYRRFTDWQASERMKPLENKLLIGRLSELSGAKLKFHSSIIEPIITANKADLEWMEARCGQSLKEDLSAGDEKAVRSETDLLTYAPTTLEWLAAQLEGSKEQDLVRADMSPFDVALCMNELAFQLTGVRQTVQPLEDLTIPASNKAPKQSAARKSLRARPALNPVRLKTKKLSEFDRIGDPPSLMQVQKDSIYVNETAKSESQAPYLNDIGGSPYILSLIDALIVPKSVLKRGMPDPFPSPPTVKLPARLKYKTNANLLISANNEVMADSFARKDVHPALQPSKDDGWEVQLPQKEEYIDQTCFYIDWVCNHFGHALVDTPARLWALLDSYGLNLDDCLFVGFGTHGVRTKRESRAEWLNNLLKAYGVRDERLLITEKTIRCRRLLVPKRISPFMTESGPEYNAFMQQVGDRLIAPEIETKSTARKLFLSRSDWAKPRRQLGNDTASRLDSLFESLGYQVLHPQKLTLAQQVVAVRGATHLAGCVGSQLHLAAFCREPAPTLLRIAPKFQHPGTDTQILAQIGGQVHDFLVDCEPEPGSMASTSGWTLEERDFPALREFVIKHSAD